MKYGTTKRREKEIRRLARIVAETSSEIYEEHFYLSQAKMYFLRAKNKHGAKWVTFAQHKLDSACRRIAIERYKL